MAKDKYNMDSHKLRWHIDRVLDWKSGKRIPPLHIDLGITTGCNLACKYCYGVLQGRTGFGTSVDKRVDMPKDALIKLINDAKKIGVRSIAFIGEGENTLNPALYDALEEAKKIDLDVSLATNGILIREDKIDVLLSALKWLRINISAATPESYLKIHQIDLKLFNIVIKNIKKIVKAKKDGNYPTTLGLQMVITKENADQVVPLAKLGKELGVDYSVFKPCSDTSDKKLDSPDKEYLEMEPVFKEAEKYSGNNYSVIIKRTKLGNLGIKDYKTCFGTQFILAISGNGDVFPCGHWFGFRKEEFVMGNVVKDSFINIVNSERYWEVQKKVQSVNVNKECESNCRQHYINQFLWKLSIGEISLEDTKPGINEKKPEHINFI